MLAYVATVAAVAAAVAAGSLIGIGLCDANYYLMIYKSKVFLLDIVHRMHGLSE